MSLVYIINHNENIYDHELVKDHPSDNYLQRLFAVHKNSTINSTRISQEISQPQLKENLVKYKKECTTLVNTGGSSGISARKKYQWRTMGPPDISLNEPSSFLKKRCGVKWITQADHKCIRRKIPLVPRHDEFMPLPEHCSKNYVNINKTQMSSLTPKRPLPKYAYTVHGDVRLLCNSGIMPTYIFSANYGKVPNYLKSLSKTSAFYQSNKKNNNAQHIERIDDDIVQERLRRYVKEGDRKCDIRQISNEERAQIILGLKEKWRINNKIYLTQSVHTDTLSKRKRKEDLTNMLKQIERDILFLESNPALFVELDEKE